MSDADFTLTPELLLRAYTSGIFPMAESRDDPELFWVDPRSRGILPLDKFHISRSLARRMRRGGYEVALDRDFEAVLQACAARDETWINDQISELYTSLFTLGHAHSLAVYEQGELAGGVYGVAIGGAFFGESMFSHRTDGSKLALAHLTDHLRRCRFTLFDTQFLTDHLASLGAIEITRNAYHLRLEHAVGLTRSIKEIDLETDPYSVLQRSTQTS
ncbi:leucyl/phenylalanyl-tRNA--protein transferase [Roseovarius sp. 2305UL8-3]|uniref:leucyl/phenylalanyl-tRNA--protein transferase n=1 Tax=Roseovarius conchicola TaxID=3121636 RepID=UPI00352781A0